MPVKVMRLEGERFELALEDPLFPKALKLSLIHISEPTRH